MAQALAKSSESMEQALSDRQFEEAMRKIEDAVMDINRRALEIAEFMARMSVEQVREAKRRLRGFISMERIDRLVLFGRGMIPEYLAREAKTLPASVLRVMPRRVVDEISDPNRSVEVFTRRGVVLRSLGELNPVEFDMVVDPHKGIRAPREQRSVMVESIAQPPKRKAVKGDFDTMEKIEYCEERKALLLTVRESGRRVLVPLRAIRDFVR
jgi:hypothetical protein